MNRCPKDRCGYVYVDETKFCNRCGTKLVDTEKCEYCETELMPNWGFCEQCGRPVK